MKKFESLYEIDDQGNAVVCPTCAMRFVVKDGDQCSVCQQRRREKIVELVFGICLIVLLIVMLFA